MVAVVSPLSTDTWVDTNLTIWSTMLGCKTCQSESGCGPTMDRKDLNYTLSGAPHRVTRHAKVNQNVIPRIQSQKGVSTDYLECLVWLQATPKQIRVYPMKTPTTDCPECLTRLQATPKWIKECLWEQHPMCYWDRLFRCEIQIDCKAIITNKLMGLDTNENMLNSSRDILSLKPLVVRHLKVSLRMRSYEDCNYHLSGAPHWVARHTKANLNAFQGFRQKRPQLLTVWSA